jgi:hypothetical protein
LCEQDQAVSESGLKIVPTLYFFEMAGEDVDPSTSKLPGLPGFHPYNIQPWTLGTLISVTLLAFLSVALRLAARRLTKQILWWDDWMIIFSMV